MELTKQHKLEISKMFLFLFLVIALIIYTLKICGVNIYGDLLVSERLQDISSTLESFWLTDILLYATLGFACMYFITYALAQIYYSKSKYHWHLWLMILMAIVFSALRKYVLWFDTITFVFDALQYVVSPIVFCKLLGISNRNIINRSTSLYLQLYGLLFVSWSLNLLAYEPLFDNFITYVALFFEVYIGMAAVYIISVLEKGGKNGISYTSIEQDK